MTFETNEQILHQMNINLGLLEVCDCRLTHTLSVTSTTTKKWALCICAQGCRLLLFCWILEHVWQSGIFFIFFLSKAVLINEALVVEVTLKVCVKRQSHTSKSSRFIFIWCKIWYNTSLIIYYICYINQNKAQQSYLNVHSSSR
jgi:hypothetical protein